MVAALAVEVTLVRDTEDEDRRDVDPLHLPAGSYLCGLVLPVQGADEETSLGGISESSTHSSLVEDSQRIIKKFGKVNVRHNIHTGYFQKVYSYYKSLC